MVRWFRRALVLVCGAILVSSLPFSITDSSVTVLYTVSGIMFSLGLSQIMAFSFSEIPNDTYVERFRVQLRAIRRSFLILFAIGSLFILVMDVEYSFRWRFLQIDTRSVVSLYQLFCLAYFARNFAAMQQIKEEIEDQLRKRL